MADIIEYLLIGLVLLLIVLIICYSNINIDIDGFGTDNKPFEPDNTLLNRNPWDDIDYIVPVYIH